MTLWRRFNMLHQLVLLVLAFNLAAGLDTCYECEQVSTTVTSSADWSTDLTNEVTRRTTASTSGNCLDPSASAPDTVSCNGTGDYCSTAYAQYTLADTDNSVTMTFISRDCQTPTPGRASWEIEGCWDAANEDDQSNPYVADALRFAGNDTAASDTVSVSYEVFNWCLCNAEDNCNADASAGHTMAAAMLVAAMTLLNFL